VLGEVGLNLIEDSKRNPRAYRPDAITPERIERRRQQALAQLAPTASDAWGSELWLSFDVGDHRAIFLSLGPDKQKGSADDVVCVINGRKEADNVDGWHWTFDKSWIVPEGLDAVVSSHVTRTFGSVEYSKLVK
jgi:hypothetical protein